MNRTNAPLKLLAYGGDVREGQECWLFDVDTFTVERIPAAHLVDLYYEVMLLHENRLHKDYRIATSEAAAREQLASTAHAAITVSRDRLEAATRFLESQTATI